MAKPRDAFGNKINVGDKVAIVFRVDYPGKPKIECAPATVTAVSKKCVWFTEDRIVEGHRHNGAKQPNRVVRLNAIIEEL